MADIVRCSQGHENREGEIFCRVCNERIGEGGIACLNCGARMDRDSNFCGKCGKSVSPEGHDNGGGVLWQRGPDIFATRLHADDLPGILRKGVVVEQGTKALLFINGALADVLLPGRHDASGPAERLKRFEPYREATAILIDAGDLEFQLSLSGIYTKDPVEIDITCRVVARIGEPVFFFNNAMKGRRDYFMSEVRQALYDELHNAFNEAVGRKSVTELNWDLPLKQELEVYVENHLRTTFQRSGFILVQLSTIDYRFRKFDQVRGRHEEVFLLVSEDEAKLKGRKRLFEVFSENQLQDIYEETRKAEYFRKIGEANIAKASAEAEADLGLKKVAADREADELRLAADTRLKLKEYLLDKGKSDEEIGSYLVEIEKSRLLREQEIKELERTLAEKDVDHDIRRQFLLRKLDLEQNIDYDRIRLTGKSGVELELVELDAKKKRIQHETDLANMRSAATAKREETLRDQLARAHAEHAEDLADVETARIAREMQLAMDAKDLEMRLSEERQKMLIQIEAEKERLEIKIKADEADLRLVLEKEQARNKREMEMMEAFSQASVEAIIAMSAPEQARLVKDLKETEILKGFSGDAAKAMEEKYRNMTNEERERIYRMLIEEKNRSAQEKDRILADTMVMSERIFDKAIEAQKDVVKGVSQAGEANAMVCLKCKTNVSLSPGRKFCPNCGTELF